MILYDLVCRKDHAFEGWFKGSDTFDAQVKAGEVACPACGDVKVRKALSAPAVVTGAASESRAIMLRNALVELRKQVESNFDNVGKRFPEEARRIHYGEAKERPIYGDASAEEASDLREEGIEVVAIPWPDRKDS